VLAKTEAPEIVGLTPWPSEFLHPFCRHRVVDVLSQIDLNRPGLCPYQIPRLLPRWISNVIDILRSNVAGLTAIYRTSDRLIS
jgi:hypothetical protein